MTTNITTFTHSVLKASRGGLLLVLMALLAAGFWLPAAKVQSAGSAGSFIPHPTTPTFGALTALSEPNDIKLGDIDGDGDLDVLLVQGLRSDPDTLWLNDGKGNFSHHADLPYDVVENYGDSTSGNLADLDGDGDLDVLITNFLNDYTMDEYIWWNDGHGNFSYGLKFNRGLADGTTLYFTRWAAIGNVDGNPGLDVITIQGHYPMVVYSNDGEGILSIHQTYENTETTIHGTLADIDGDSDLDLIRSSISYGEGTHPGVLVDLNNGSGSFAPHPTAPNPLTVETRVTLAGDLDGDGDVDLVAGMNNAAQVLLNNGSGGFCLGEWIPVSASASDIFRGDIGDIDGDGDLDIVLANANSDTDEIFVNDGHGVFTPNPNTPSVAAGLDTRAAQFADIDHDGDLDLLTASVGEGVRVWINNTAPNVTDINKPAGNEDTQVTFTATDFTSHFSGGSGTLASIQVISLPSNGNLRLGSNVVSENDVITAANLGNLNFMPTANWNGTTSFTWRASDGTEYSNTAAVNITINPVNDAPVIASIPLQNAYEGEQFTLNLAPFVSDIDSPSNAFVFSSCSMGSLTSSGAYAWTPGETYGNTTATVSFTVSDGAGGSKTGSFQIFVTETNQPPVLDTPINSSFLVNLPISLVVSGHDNDLPANTLTYGVQGTLPVGAHFDPATHTFTWTPNVSQIGDHIITFTIYDGTCVTTFNRTITVTIANKIYLPYLGR